MYVDQNDPEPRARVLFVADADPHARRVTESALLRRFAPWPGPLKHDDSESLDQI
jgi:hypothetical protein